MANQEAAAVINLEDIDAWRAFRRGTESYIDLDGSQFSSLTLSYFDFSGCSFDSVLFDDCIMERVNFNSCSINRSKFRKCDLTSSEFGNASLETTNFDRCELYGAWFDGTDGLTTEQIEKSFGDDTTTLPDELVPPEGWHTAPDDDEVDLADQSAASAPPRIPERVFAPVETSWVNERLQVIAPQNSSLLSQGAENQSISSLKYLLDDLVSTLRSTNFDPRVIDDINKVAEDFPSSSEEFRSKIFSIWYRLRPTFEYAVITKGNHSDYVQARVTSFELNLRDVLSSYPEWREYEAASQAIKVSEQFDWQRFIAHQHEFVSGLQRAPDQIDPSVPEKMKFVISVQETSYSIERPKLLLYGAASSIANIISRILSKILKEVAEGSSEGVKEGTKKLVSTTIAAGGGGALLWFLTTGIQSFHWLKNAWEFVRKILGY